MRNAKCHSDGFNDDEVFSTGGRERAERGASTLYSPVDVSSLPLGIVLRRLPRLYVEYIYPYLSLKRTSHTIGVYIVLVI